MESIKEKLERFEWEEEHLQFEHFSNDDAWELGTMLVAEAKKQGVHPAFEICVNGCTVFRYGFPGTNLHNEKWLKRKKNTVDTVHKSSLHVWALLQHTGESLSGDWFLPEQDYAGLGGGFPVIIRGTGTVGTVCCSGLPHEQDHQMVVDTIEAYLKKNQAGGRESAMSEKSYRSELVGLLGDPVDENPTVVTIEAGFKALGLDYRYNTMRVKPEDLGTAIAGLKALGYKGTHITIPHKVEVLKYLDHVAPDAQLMGAVNTVYIKDGETYGENTDGKGFLLTLEHSGIALAGKRVVILGAGGAARAITVELANAGVSSIEIVNASHARGEALCKLLNDNCPVEAKYTPWLGTYTVPQGTDILVQATSIGLYPDTARPDIDYSALDPKTVVCDIVPNPAVTGFIKAARLRGCKTFIGLDMLVRQGAISFELWTGRKAPFEAMRQALEEEYGGNT